MTPAELYEATNGTLVIGRRREQVELALAVQQGIVREVYRVGAWFPAAWQHTGLAMRLCTC